MLKSSFILPFFHPSIRPFIDRYPDSHTTAQSYSPIAQTRLMRSGNFSKLKFHDPVYGYAYPSSTSSPACLDPWRWSFDSSYSAPFWRPWLLSRLHRCLLKVICSLKVSSWTCGAVMYVREAVLPLRVDEVFVAVCAARRLCADGRNFGWVKLAQHSVSGSPSITGSSPRIGLSIALLCESSEAFERLLSE
jgi:hypothetical protein